MKDIELKNKVIIWLKEKSIEYKTRPQKFTPTEVAHAVGGNSNRIGFVDRDIELELNAQGIDIRYVNKGSKRYFELN
ncbi:MAG: hypothetical protein WBJ45_08600 [Limnohabitans sp.]|uniref:hypothetical protein n=1 Tax=Limnohabitans sp. TaxID=1907725 RepID=UPI003BB08F5F